MSNPIANLGRPATEASALALAARWGGRGKSKYVRVDPDVAEAVKAVPERVRRGVVSAAIKDAVAAYLRAPNRG
jgi:hypothetical protein